MLPCSSSAIFSPISQSWFPQTPAAVRQGVMHVCACAELRAQPCFLGFHHQRASLTPLSPDRISHLFELLQQCPLTCEALQWLSSLFLSLKQFDLSVTLLLTTHSVLLQLNHLSRELIPLPALHCALSRLFIRVRIWGLGAAEGLVSQVDSQVATAAFDGESWGVQVSDGSPAGGQAHRLALVKKAPPLCSHRRWM